MSVKDEKQPTESENPSKDGKTEKPRNPAMAVALIKAGLRIDERKKPCYPS